MLLASVAPAQEPAKLEREIWLCRGVVQTAPGEPLQPEERRLEFDFTSGDVVMSAGGARHRARFQASRVHFEAEFPVTVDGGVQAMESVSLARSNGRMTATARSADGRQLRLFRSSCRPEDVPGQ
ncbi:MAG TPA: hypothetical protein VF104_03485 [Burkholderiales bacterium]